MSGDSSSNSPLPPGVERRRRLRQERRRERWIQCWRLPFLASAATGLGWVLLTHDWTLRHQDQVQVSGSQRLGRDAVIEAAALSFPLPLLSLRPGEVEAELLKKLPVQAVAVERRLLPPGLTVELEDRRPLAAATRQGEKGLLRGMVDRRGQWMARTASDHGEEPETTIEVRGWTPAQRGSVARLLEQRDQLGSPLESIEIGADGSLSLRTAALGLVQLGNDPRLLEQQLITLSQLSRSLPPELRRQAGSSIDLSDPRQPELQLPAQAKPAKAKTSEP